MLFLVRISKQFYIMSKIIEEEPRVNKIEKRPVLYPFEDLTRESFAEYSGGRINEEGNIEYPGATLHFKSGKNEASFISHQEWTLEDKQVIDSSLEYLCDGSIAVIREGGTVDIVFKPFSETQESVQYFTLSAEKAVPFTKNRKDADSEIKQATDLLRIKVGY